MIQFQEKLGQIAGQKYGQTLFHRTLPATAGGLTSANAVDLNLKFKDIDYDAGLTKNCCIPVIIRKISSIHKVILNIQQILGSHEQNGYIYS